MLSGSRSDRIWDTHVMGPTVSRKAVEERHRLALASLTQSPDPGGLSTFLGLLTSGENERQIIGQFVGSREFFADAGSTNQRFVTRGYETILGRAPDQGGLSTFSGLLSSGVTRTQVASDLLNSLEFETDTVGLYYRYLLGKAPDPGGLADQVGFLSTGGTIERFVANVVGSSEFYSDATS